MEEQHSTIKCPNCGEEINVNDVIYHQLEEQLKGKLNADLAKEREKMNRIAPYFYTGPICMITPNRSI